MWLTPFDSWAFSLFRPVDFAGHLTTPRNHFIVPVLYYGSECCRVSRSQFNSLEFTIYGSFMKIFHTRFKDIVLYCMETFNVQNPYHANNT